MSFSLRIKIHWYDSFSFDFVFSLSMFTPLNVQVRTKHKIGRLLLPRVTPRTENVQCLWTLGFVPAANQMFVKFWSTAIFAMIISNDSFPYYLCQTSKDPQNAYLIKKTDENCKKFAHTRHGTKDSNRNFINSLAQFENVERLPDLCIILESLDDRNHTSIETERRISRR